MIHLLLLRIRKLFTLIININTIRISSLRIVMLRMNITLLRKIMLMMNLCLVMIPFHPLLLPLSIHLLNILSLSNLPQIPRPSKIRMFFMQFPIVILKGYLPKKLKLTFTWLKMLPIMLNLKSLSLHML